MRRILMLLAGLIAVVPARSFAADFGLLFTGRTHAMIYPCTCAVEPAGGLKRRATLVKQFAARRIPYLLVDSGDSFAGGPMDQYMVTPELDKRRTEVNLQAMAAMGYDCAAVNEGVFNYGYEFFRDTATRLKVTYVSANVRAVPIMPYVIKKMGGLPVGITSVAPVSVQKTAGEKVSVIDPREGLKAAIDEMVSKGCEFIILLSDLSEDESVKLIADFPWIEVLVLNRPKNEAPVGGDRIVLKSFWQGRHIGEAVLGVSSEGSVRNMQLTERVAGPDVPDDKDMAAIVPACFSPSQCVKPGSVSECVNPGENSAKCEFSAAPRVRLQVISAADCLTCNSDNVIKGVSSQIPGLDVVRVPYPGAEAARLIKELDIKTLPAYVFDRNDTARAQLGRFKLLTKGNHLILSPEVSGFGYYVDRPRIPGRIDLFVSLLQKGSADLLWKLKEFFPQVHFIATKEGGTFRAPNGIAEAEENLRSVCVQKYHPALFYNYLLCRAGNPESTWWENCLEGVDTAQVRACALGDEGAQLLEQNTALNRELEVGQGPTYLYENKEIFGSENVPSKEELRRIFIRK